MEKEENSAVLTFKTTPKWLYDLDAWRKRQPVTPNRSEVIRVAVSRLISEGKDVRTEQTAE